MFFAIAGGVNWPYNSGKILITYSARNSPWLAAIHFAAIRLLPQSGRGWLFGNVLSRFGLLAGKEPYGRPWQQPFAYPR